MHDSGPVGEQKLLGAYERDERDVGRCSARSRRGNVDGNGGGPAGHNADGDDGVEEPHLARLVGSILEKWKRSERYL